MTCPYRVRLLFLTGGSATILCPDEDAALAVAREQVAAYGPGTEAEILRVVRVIDKAGDVERHGDVEDRIVRHLLVSPGESIMGRYACCENGVFTRQRERVTCPDCLRAMKAWADEGLRRP